MRRQATFSDRTLLILAVALFAFGVILDVMDDPGWLLDAARAAVIIGSVYILVASLIIVRIYWRNFKIAPQQARLLPRHVIQLGLLVILLLIHVCGFIIDKVDSPAIWYSLPILLPGVFVGVFGLHDMISWLPRRRPDLRPTGERRA